MRAVNLIPVEQRGGSGPAAGRSEGGAYAVLVLMGGLALFVLLYGTARHDISSNQAKAASLAVQTQRAQAAAAQLAPYTSFLALREQRVQAVSELAQSRFNWAHAFHELGRVLPHDASILSLSGTVGSAGGTSSSSAASSSSATSSSSAKAGASGATGASSTVTSATPPGSVPVFALTGCATSQAEVAQTLTRLRLIDGVSEVVLQSSTKPAGGGAGGGSTAAGGCPTTDPTFSVTVTFDPLPATTPTSVATVAPARSTGAAG